MATCTDLGRRRLRISWSTLLDEGLSAGVGSAGALTPAAVVDDLRAGLAVVARGLDLGARDGGIADVGVGGRGVGHGCPFFDSKESKGQVMLRRIPKQHLITFHPADGVKMVNESEQYRLSILFALIHLLYTLLKYLKSYREFPLPHFKD